MPLATMTAHGSPPTRIATFLDDVTGTPVYVFASQPSTVTVTNSSATSMEIFIDHYRVFPSIAYEGNVSHVALAPGASATVSWSLSDTNWRGIGINGDFLDALTYHVSIDAAMPTYCEHGTEPQPSAAFVYYLTPGLIDTWLAADGLPWLAPLFTALWFSTVTTASVCGAGPPPMPTIDLSTFEASLATIWDILKVVMWPNVCRCTSGSPTPVPFPAPSPTEPPGWPTTPSFGCSNADLCAALTQLQLQLASIQRVVGQDLGLTTLIQRYRLPFASVPGAVHSGLTGSGSFAVSRLLGMRVQVTTPPSDGLELEGTPPYVWNQGWMSILTADDLIEERRITQSRMEWFPQQMQNAVTFGYWLKDGTVATFQELQAET